MTMRRARPPAGGVVDTVTDGEARAYRAGPAGISWGAKEILAAVLATAAAMVAIFGGYALLLRALGLSSERAADQPAVTITLVVGQVLLDLCAVAAAAVVSLRRYGLSPRAWGLRRERAISLGACILVLTASFATLVVYGALTRALGLGALEPRGNVPGQLFEHRAVVPFTVFLVVIVAPLAEEMFFRGFVFNGLRRAVMPGVATPSAPDEPEPLSRRGPAKSGWRMGMVGAALLSGLMWALIHGQLGLVIPITVIGFMFAVLLARTGSLWNAILVHVLFNLIGVLANLAGRSG